MKEMNKTAQTPHETARELSDLAEKLEEMDKAEGFFGESMAEALTDDYLDEVSGGLERVPLTTPGGTYYAPNSFTCTFCGRTFKTWDSNQSVCNDCKGRDADRT